MAENPLLPSAGNSPGKAAPAKAPLIVDVPPEWVVEYSGDKGVDLFLVTRRDGRSALLMFVPWPVPSGKQDIPALVRDIAQQFLKEAKKSTKFKLENERYVRAGIDGAHFSGESAFFTVTGGTCQVIFMISDGSGIWSGQFSGEEALWGDALQILKSLRRN